MENLKIREDLNDMVKEIKWNVQETKYGIRYFCNVKLFNDEIIEFSDKNGVYEVLKSYSKCGEKDFVKSRKLVEEFKVDDSGSVVSTYICLRYELVDGTIFKLFLTKFNSNLVINNYYNLFKKLQAMPKK